MLRATMLRLRMFLSKCSAGAGVSLLSVPGNNRAIPHSVVKSSVCQLRFAIKTAKSSACAEGHTDLLLQVLSNVCPPVLLTGV